ncbi:hypothetical protein AC1031_007363 [Aphanomyces cochlioides]|nr:hypothetical protein AC1031_007363 [Aphanomyces cochlioides]
MRAGCPAAAAASPAMSKVSSSELILVCCLFWRFATCETTHRSVKRMAISTALSDIIDLFAIAFEHHSLVDLVYDGLMSRLLYWMLFGYVVSSLPIVVWHLHKFDKLHRLSTTTVAIVSVVLCGFGLLFVDTLVNKIYLVLGAVGGAFCTYLHGEIVHLVVQFIKERKPKHE